MREEFGGVTANPCSKIERHATRSRERILSAAELPQFWAAFDSAGLVAGTALKVLLLTGQRPGEVACMRREHIQDGWWELPGAPKNGQSHRVWLAAPVQAILAELDDEPPATGFVFAGSRGRPVGSLDAAMRAICNTLGVPRCTPHDLRRTHGSTITAMGFGRELMNRIQNHREGGISDVYDRYQYSEENKRVMESVAAHILALATGEPEASNILAFPR